MKTEVLKDQYHEISGRADRMRGAIYDQFSQLIDDADVTLGVPIKSRAKKWTSLKTSWSAKISK